MNWRVGCALTLAVATSIAGCGDDDDCSVRTPVATATATPPRPSTTPVAEIELCDQAPHDQLCSVLPHTIVSDVEFAAGNSELIADQQRPFDVFSWQSFVALNWPATPDGMPLPDPIGSHPEAPRVWQWQHPRFLGNAVLETYIQNDASCLECHASATTAVGQDANFSFLLQLPLLMGAH